MDPFISLHDAKAKLSSLLDRAAAGEEIVIAKHSTPTFDELALLTSSADMSI